MHAHPCHFNVLQMNVLTVVSPHQNYRMKLLELMSLTSVSMTLALGIMDEPDPNAAETDAVSSLSALIIAVNVVFALCVLFEVGVEVQLTMRKQKRTKQLWKRARQKKDLLIAILMLGSPQCPNSSSDDNRDLHCLSDTISGIRENSSTESPSLVMAQKRGKNALKTKKAKSAEGNELRATGVLILACLFKCGCLYSQMGGSRLQRADLYHHERRSRIGG